MRSNILSVEELDRLDKQSGFFPEVVDTTLILDGDSAKDRAAINKMCTSIPSPFARMYLFQTAFKEVTKRQERNLNPLVYVHDEDRLYNYLVSDCLDMLEFLFYYADHEEFNVVKWTTAQLTQLDDEADMRFQRRFQRNKAHARLKKSLQDHLDTDAVLSQISTIYLFTWSAEPKNPNCKPVIIGGTSPFSLVYTSPNWVRERNQLLRGFEFKAGDNGGDLFDNDPTTLGQPRPLHVRSEAFRMYIYKMWFAYKHAFEAMPDLNRYIDQSWNIYDMNTPFGLSFAGLADTYSPDQFTKDYPVKFHDFTVAANGHVKSGKVDVITAGIPLRMAEFNPEACINDDYKIASPAKDDSLPLEKDGMNEGKRVQRPLFLDPAHEVPGALYVNNKPWGNFMGRWKLYDTEPAEYWKRKLPGTQYPYPYLRPEDFFEDKIIGLAGKVSDKDFLTGSRSSNVTYLAPLKRTFFKYFPIDELFEMDPEGNFQLDDHGYPKMKDNIYSLDLLEDGSVTVTLRIPLMAGKTDDKPGKSIEVSRTYIYDEMNPEHNDIVFFEDASNGVFNFSIFPFYQIIGNGAQYNKYSVMLGYVGDIKLHFYGKDLNTEIAAKAQERTCTNNIRTRYYDIDEAFDIIEVEANGVRGLAVPLMPRKKLGGDKFVFCVDFGTTNTHVAWGKMNGSSANASVVQVGDFTYDSAERQVVSLFDTGAYMHYKIPNKREFIPEAMGSSDLAMPVRTIACSKSSFMTDTASAGATLFADTNLGFYFLNEESGAPKENQYVPNIKWRQGPKFDAIRQAYFDEIMWLIKNKVVLNGGSMDFAFNFTYPQSMERPDRDDLYKYWNQARVDVKAGSPDNNMSENALKHPIEGIVPWFALRKRGKVKADETYLNVDIGGGTMDMVFQDAGSGQNFTYSARFAANDLWGDGCDEASDDKKNNAFIQDFMAKRFDGLPESVQKRYNAFMETASKSPEMDSADVISFLFKNDEDFKFTDFIRKDSYLMTLLLMHFVSIIYYIGLIMQKDDLKVPDKISFTGMGSLYVKIISTDEKDIAEIIKSVLKYMGFPAEVVDYLQVILVENPKVITAHGGVVFYAPGDKSISNAPYSEQNVWGYEDEDPLDSLLGKEVSGKRESVLRMTKKMLEYFRSPQFSDIRSRLKCGWKFQNLDMAKLDRLTKSSFDCWLRFNAPAPDECQNDPLFFWPLKDTFFWYGRDIIG